ncbi:hypothetical protein F2P81_000397 [Scophthalmus maximus]|uniref:Uncharacterized protein n=1 Tax=Scophthalmus maximus TaxID=52904 RepID=A0A6A4TU79_SCOMX|nr:hypothetical protein F2P81_000397 [Scophthalmus maximus]
MGLTRLKKEDGGPRRNSSTFWEKILRVRTRFQQASGTLNLSMTVFATTLSRLKAAMKMIIFDKIQLKVERGCLLKRPVFIFSQATRGREAPTGNEETSRDQMKHDEKPCWTMSSPDQNTPHPFYVPEFPQMFRKLLTHSALLLACGLQVDSSPDDPLTRSQSS